MKTTRFISRLVPILIGFAAPLLQAQTTPPHDKPAPILFTTLSLDGTLDGLHYDLGPRTVRLSANASYLSSPYQAPDDGRLRIYRHASATPGGKAPDKITVATIELPGPGPYLLLLRPGDAGTLNVRLVDNSWRENPPLSSRVINASARQTAVLVGTGMAEIAPGQLHTFSGPSAYTDVIDFKVATYENDAWTIRVLTPQALYPGTRNIFIIKDQSPSRERPDPKDLDVFKIVDTSQPPADSRLALKR